MLFELRNAFLDTDTVASVEFKKNDDKYKIYVDGRQWDGYVTENVRLELESIFRRDPKFFYTMDTFINATKVTSAIKGARDVKVYMGSNCVTVTDDAKRIDSFYNLLTEQIKILNQENVEAVTSFNTAADKKQKSVLASEPVTLEDARKDIDSMIGCERAKRELNENLALVMLVEAQKEMGIVSSEPVSRHMAYIGNPGTGKTTFARKVAGLYHAAGIIRENKVVEVKREDLVGEYVGHTAPKIAAVIEKAKGGILFIDEAYSLVSNKSENDFGIEAINTLVPAMENMRDDLIVIFAGYPEEIQMLLSSNPGLESRCANMINFEDYTGPQLNEIMQQMVKKQGLVMTPAAEQEASQIIEKAKSGTDAKNFANARTVRNLVEQSQKALANRLVAEGKLPRPVDADFDMKELVTVTKADLANISVGVLKRKEMNRIGYGASR